MSTRYCLADYVTMPGTPEFTPALPDSVGFLLLASPDGSTWGLFALEDRVEWSEKIQPVPPSVEAILDSGRRYPPALALARDEAATVRDDGDRGRAAFIERYVARVSHHLQRQPRAPYLLAEALRDEPHYLSRGQNYWVLRYLRGEDVVLWVSEDYFVYRNPASDFRLLPAQLDSLLLPFEDPETG